MGEIDFIWTWIQSLPYILLRLFQELHHLYNYPFLSRISFCSAVFYRKLRPHLLFFSGAVFLFLILLHTIFLDDFHQTSPLQEPPAPLHSPSPIPSLSTLEIMFNLNFSEDLNPPAICHGSFPVVVSVSRKTQSPPSIQCLRSRKVKKRRDSLGAVSCSVWGLCRGRVLGWAGGGLGIDLAVAVPGVWCLGGEANFKFDFSFIFMYTLQQYIRIYLLDVTLSITFFVKWNL